MIKIIKSFLKDLLIDSIEDKLFFSVGLFDENGKAVKYLFIPFIPQIGSYVQFDNVGFKYRFKVNSCEIEFTNDNWKLIKLKGECHPLEKATY